MLIVPLQPIPSQTLQTQLDNQSCAITVEQYAYGLFITLAVAGQNVIAGQICENLVKLVREEYLGFSGDLVFVDLQGNLDPSYNLLGTRFQLVYLEPADLAAG